MTEVDQSELLWNLLESHFIQKRAKNSAKELSLGNAATLDWRPEIEAPLFGYLADADQPSLLSIARISAKFRYFSPSRHVLLVATLFENGAISIREAFSMLSSLREGEDADNASVKRVLDVVWHLKEDEKDGLMVVEEDNLLSETLQEISKNASR
jgi:hypothetical protein